MKFMKKNTQLLPNVHYGVIFATWDREPEGLFQQRLRALGVHLRLFTTEVKENWTQYAGYIETPMTDVTPTILQTQLGAAAIAVAATPVSAGTEFVLDSGDILGPSISPVRFLANDDTLSPYSTWIAYTTWHPKAIPAVPLIGQRLASLKVALSQPERATVSTQTKYPVMFYAISTTDTPVTPRELNAAVGGTVTLIVSEPLAHGMSSEAFWTSHKVRDELLEVAGDFVDYNVAFAKDIIPGGGADDPWDIFDWLKLGAGVAITGVTLYYGSKLYKELKSKPRKARA